jgi:magnesium transporter
MLINCVAYQDGKRLGEIQPAEIHRYLAMPGCFVWVALLDRDPALLEQMRGEFGLHPLAVEDAQNGHQRPKIEDYGDSLFVVLHLLEADDDDLRVGEVDVFAGPNYVLTIRSHAEKGFQSVRARCEAEPELLKLGSGYVLYALIDAVVDRYFPLLDALETELEGIEDRIFAGVYGMNFEHMPELGWKFGYVTVIALMVAIDAYLFHRLRKAKWL